jgi:mono/diheme cytochrome c family protein
VGRRTGSDRRDDRQWSQRRDAAARQLGAETIKDLANYVRSLSGLPADSVRAAKGQEAFNSAGCSGCHGPDGKGMHAVGAPNLTDKIWLYGSSEATIIETITKGRTNQMPAWKEFLGESQGARAGRLCAQSERRQQVATRLNNGAARLAAPSFFRRRFQLPQLSSGEARLAQVPTARCLAGNRALQLLRCS